MRLDTLEKNQIVQEHLDEYNKTEIIRRAVREVQKRSKAMDEHRKMKGKAYDGVKSKIARNMKVIDRENRKAGFFQNPYKAGKSPVKVPPRSAAKNRASARGKN